MNSLKQVVTMYQTDTISPFAKFYQSNQLLCRNYFRCRDKRYLVVG